jgi:hypothetical protein
MKFKQEAIEAGFCFWEEGELSHSADDIDWSSDYSETLEAYSRLITDPLVEENARLKNIILHLLGKNQYFICGDNNELDASGLPEKIQICPALGADGFAVYTKTKDYSAPEY